MPNLVMIYQPWLRRTFVEAGKVAENGDFLLIITIFWANNLPEDNASDRAQPLLDDPHFFLPFQLPTSLYHTYLQRAKIGDLKERSQKHTVLLLY